MIFSEQLDAGFLMKLENRKDIEFILIDKRYIKISKKISSKNAILPEQIENFQLFLIFLLIIPFKSSKEHGEDRWKLANQSRERLVRLQMHHRSLVESEIVLEATVEGFIGQRRS